MVDAPETETAVFIRMLKGGVAVEGRGRDVEDRVEVAAAGEVLVLRWRDVRGVVERGDAELV